MCDGEDESEVWSVDGDGFYSDFLKLESAQKKALKQLNWNQFLRGNKCIKQWTNDNGPVSLLLNEKKVKTKSNSN